MLKNGIFHGRRDLQARFQLGVFGLSGDVAYLMQFKMAAAAILNFTGIGNVRQVRNADNYFDRFYFFPVSQGSIKYSPILASFKTSIFFNVWLNDFRYKIIH